MLTPEDLSKVAFDSCEPMKVTLELTTRCNFRCGHCYNHDRSDISLKGDRGLDTSDVKEIIKQAAEMGVIELTFTGGEATLRPDLTDLIRYASQRHLIVCLKTNGSTLTPEKVDALVDAGLQDLAITLYGFSSETHDAFTGVKGSFNRVLQTAAYANQNHPGLLQQCTIAALSHNIHEMEKWQSVEQEIGSPVNTNISCHNRNDLSTTAEDYAPTLSEALQYSPVSKEEVELVQLKSGGDASTFRCGCARISFAIFANGDVGPCVEVPWIAGNVLDQPLAEIWRESEVFAQIRNLKSKDWKTCHGCPLTQVCNRRNCNAYKQDNNYTDADPAAGLFTYERFKRFGVSKPPCVD